MLANKRHKGPYQPYTGMERPWKAGPSVTSYTRSGQNPRIADPSLDRSGVLLDGLGSANQLCQVCLFGEALPALPKRRTKQRSFLGHALTLLPYAQFLRQPGFFGQVEAILEWCVVMLPKVLLGRRKFNRGQVCPGVGGRFAVRS